MPKSGCALILSAPFKTMEIALRKKLLEVAPKNLKKGARY